MEAFLDVKGTKITDLVIIHYLIVNHMTNLSISYSNILGHLFIRPDDEISSSFSHCS